MFGAGFHHAHGGQQGKGDHGHRDGRQLGAGGAHHDQNTQGGDHLGDDLGQVLAQGAVESVHVVGDGAEDFAVGVGVVVVQLEGVHLSVDVAPQPLHHPGGQLGHAKALQDGEQLGDQIKPHQGRQQQQDGRPVKDAPGHPFVKF